MVETNLPGCRCPKCGAYLLKHPSKLNWLQCPWQNCGYARALYNDKVEPKKDKFTKQTG